MSPRPTRVEIDDQEIQVRTSALEPQIRASVQDFSTVTCEVQPQTDVQIEVVEAI